MRTFLKFAAAVFFVMAAAFLAYSVPFFWQQEQILRNWPQIQAKVTHAEVITMTTTSGEKLYNAGLEFEFQAHGEALRGGYVFPHASIHREPKEKLVARYPIGSVHIIRFNPEMPRDVRIHAGYNVDFFVVPVFIVGMGLICAARGGLALWLSRLGRAPRRTQEAVAQAAG